MHPAITIGTVRSLCMIVDVAMRQIPRFTERISSCVREMVSVILRCNCCLSVRSKQDGRFMCRWAQFRQALDEILSLIHI